MMHRISPEELREYVQLVGDHEVVIMENTARTVRWQKSFEHRGKKTLYLGTRTGFEKWKREQGIP